MEDRYLFCLQSISDDLDGLQSKIKDLKDVVYDLHTELKIDEAKLKDMTKEDDLETLQKQAGELYEKI